MLETLQGAPEQHSFVVAATHITVEGNFVSACCMPGLQCSHQVYKGLLSLQ